MSQPLLVTVVMPAKNESTAIAAALDAVLAQTYPLSRVEVVVVVGGATDDTSKVASKVLAGSDVARWAVLDRVEGTTPSNLNRGLDWAEGEVIVRVDARSLIPANYIERCVAAISVAGRSVVGGSQVAIQRSASWRDRAIARALNNRLAMGWSRYRRAGAPSGPADTVYLGVFHREQLRKVGGWNDEFATNQDFELNRRMATLGDVWFEAGLPVSYLPRSSYRQIAQQYHRFGRWKARYWRSGSDRPQPRQVVLLTAPTLGLTCAVLGFSTAGAASVVVAPVLVLAGCVCLDALGGHCDPAPLHVRAAAGATNVVVGVAWWSGVVRGTLTWLD